MSAQVGPGLGDSFRKNLIEPLFFRSWIVLPWQVHPLELGVPNHPKNGWSVHHFFRFYLPQKNTSTTKNPMVYHGLSSLFFQTMPSPDAKTPENCPTKKFPSPVRGVAISSNIAVPCHVFGVDVQILHLRSREAWNPVGWETLRLQPFFKRV